jgi:hypothetical protein
MAFDINAVADKVSDSLAEELDDVIPDGFIQSGAAEVGKLAGLIVQKTFEKLAAKNNDGDA